MPPCPLRRICSDLGGASAKPGHKHGFPNSKLHPKSKATFPFLSLLGRSSIPTVTLYAGHSASQLALFYFISMQYYHTKTLPLLVSSSDLQLGKLIQTAFMCHWGFLWYGFHICILQVTQGFISSYLECISQLWLTRKPACSLPEHHPTFGNLLSCKYVWGLLWICQSLTSQDRCSQLFSQQILSKSCNKRYEYFLWSAYHLGITESAVLLLETAS